MKRNADPKPDRFKTRDRGLAPIAGPQCFDVANLFHGVADRDIARRPASTTIAMKKIVRINDLYFR